MAVSVSYAINFVESIDPVNVTGDADAASLAGGGVAVSGDHAGHTDATVINSQGDVRGSSLVNSGTGSAVAQLSDGNVVIASDNGDHAVFTIIDSDGGTVVASTASDVPFNQLLDVDVTALTGGGFVVASQAFFAGTDNDIRINIRNNDGSSVTSFSIDSTGANDQNPSVAGLADGAFAVAWHRNVGSNNEMWYAVYEANGAVRLGPTLLDNAGTVNRNASVVALDNGGFAIAYEDNGWDGDIDITLARFGANGAFVDWDDVSNNTSNYTAPSATVLSNGMIAVGSIDDFFGHNDPVWSLIDQNTGLVLTETSVGTTHNDFAPSVAGMSDGRIATFHTDGTAGDVVGQILQGTRTSTGDAADDTIQIDTLQDIAAGGDGADTFQSSVVDAFTNDSIDGGNGFDRIVVASSTSLGNTTLASIEEIEMLFPNVSTVVTVRADQIGAGLAANLLVDFSANSSPDVFRVQMRDATTVDLSQLQIQDFDAAGTENDRILVVGDGDAESIRGTLVRDQISGNDGDDILEGGEGGDVLDGGAGSDRAKYANAAAGVVASLSAPASNTGEAAGDTYSSIENLTGSAFNDTLTGNAAANGLVGGGGNDIVRGLAGNDSLFGNDGNDLLEGGSGADSLSGGGGSDRATYADAAAGVVASLSAPGGNTGDAAGDTYISIENLTGSTFNDSLTGDDAANSIAGGDGNDILNGLKGSDTLSGNDGNDVMQGGGGGDSLSGGGGSDRASYANAAAGIVASLSNPAGNTGEASGDTYSSVENLTGSAFNDILTGNNAINDLVGGAGNDRLNGLLGSDTLAGGGGSDRYRFDTTLGANNIDAITDFSVANDTIELDNAIFNAIVGLGTLSAGQFVANASGTAADANDRVIYETDTGKLFYDSNGNAAGGRVQFATVGAGLGVTNTDFVIV